MNDEEFMKKALELAKLGCGWVNPNPMVGAVIVKDGRVIGKGFHEKYGGLHAERNALANCSESSLGATIYVTLEPCCHYGKTPPCTDAIIESGIRRVVIGSFDPNPKVGGKGISILRSHGIEVVEGILKEECDTLNKSFFHYIQTGLPYVVMKYAMTMDGKIATSLGKSKWITGALARQRVHEDRHRYSAIMVGVGTVLADNPMLDCRIENGRNPLRVICDTNLRTPLQSNVITSTDRSPTLLATAITDTSLHRPYQKAGCEVVVLPLKDNQVDLKSLMIVLGKKGIDSILLEGGSSLNWSALREGIVNKIQAYIAPKLFGGTGYSPVGGIGVDSPEEAFGLRTPTISVIGEDILIESEVIDCSQEL